MWKFRVILYLLISDYGLSQDVIVRSRTRIGKPIPAADVGNPMLPLFTIITNTTQIDKINTITPIIDSNTTTNPSELTEQIQIIDVNTTTIANILSGNATDNSSIVAVVLQSVDGNSTKIADVSTKPNTTHTIGLIKEAITDGKPIMTLELVQLTDSDIQIAENSTEFVKDDGSDPNIRITTTTIAPTLLSMDDITTKNTILEESHKDANKNLIEEATARLTEIQFSNKDNSETDIIITTTNSLTTQPIEQLADLPLEFPINLTSKNTMIMDVDFLNPDKDIFDENPDKVISEKIPDKPPQDSENPINTNGESIRQYRGPTTDKTRKIINHFTTIYNHKLVSRMKWQKFLTHIELNDTHLEIQNTDSDGDILTGSEIYELETNLTRKTWPWWAKLQEKWEHNNGTQMYGGYFALLVQEAIRNDSIATTQVPMEILVETHDVNPEFAKKHIINAQRLRPGQFLDQLKTQFPNYETPNSWEDLDDRDDGSAWMPEVKPGDRKIKNRGHYDPSKEPIQTNNLLDEEYLIKTGAHGINFVQQGIAYVFPDFWEHVLVIKLPQFQNININLPNEQLCERIARESQAGYNPPYIQDTRRNCELIYKHFSELSEQVNKLLNESLIQFHTEHLTRDKREVVLAALAAIAVTAVVAGGLYVSYKYGYAEGSKHEREKFENVIQNMEQRVASLSEATQVLGENMIGLTKLVHEQEKETNRKIKLLGEITKKQLSNIESQLSTTNQILNTHMREQRDINYITIESSKLQIYLTTMLDLVKTWQLIFLRLNENKLPLSLISQKDLTNILWTIRQNLDGSFDFAIDDVNLYYQLALISHMVKRDGDNYNLYLHFRIPLKKARTANKFQIIKPNFSPFPCYELNCFNNSGEKSSLLSFNMDMVWLFDSDKNFIHDEADLINFNCNDLSEGRVCYTFYPTLLKAASACSKAIYQWDETNISKWCKFKSRRVDEYRAIQIGIGKYIFHNTTVPFYYEICPEESLEYAVEGYAEVIEITKYCEILIPATLQTLRGPLADILKGTTNYTSHTYHSDLIGKLLRRMNTSELIPEQAPLTSPNLTVGNDPDWKKFDVTMNNEELTEKIQQLYERQIEANKYLYIVDDYIRHIVTVWNVYSYISLIGQLIQVSTSLIVIFGIFTHTRLFGLIGTTIVVTNKPAKAFLDFELPKIQFLPDIEFNVIESAQALSWFLNMCFVAIFIILFVLFAKFAWFRQVRITYFYGRAEDPKGDPSERTESLEVIEPNEWAVMANLQYTANYFRYMVVEVISLRIPVTKMRMNSVHDIRTKTNANAWYLQDKNLEMVDKVRLYALDHKHRRIRDFNMTVYIPINNIRWSGGQMPRAFERSGNYGLSQISIIRNRDIGTGSGSELTTAL